MPSYDYGIFKGNSEEVRDLPEHAIVRRRPGAFGIEALALKHEGNEAFRLENLKWLHLYTTREICYHHQKIGCLLATYFYQLQHGLMCHWQYQS